MGKQYYTIKSNVLWGDSDEVSCNVLCEVNTTLQYYCSYYTPFRSATIIGISPIDGELNGLGDLSYLWSPDTQFTDVGDALLAKHGVLLNAKNKRDARRESNAYWRKGDVFNPYNGGMVREGSWCKAHKDMPKLS